MINGTHSWVLRRKWVLIAIGTPILVAAWWAFRPEKLWINKRVDEPAPFASTTAPQPIYTGLLQGKTHQTSGRASIYETADRGKYLRLTDFTTSNGPDIHVLLSQSDDENLTKDIVTGNLKGVELGQLKANQGDQNYDIPTSIDLQKYNAVVIYCERFHAVFGVAELDRF